MKNLQDSLRLLGDSIKRTPSLLTHPRRYFGESAPSLLDGTLVIFLLFLFTLIQKLLWLEPGVGRMTFGWATEQAFVNSLLVWSIFFTLFYITLFLLRQSVSLAALAGQVGAAGAPLAVVTFLSDLLWLPTLWMPSLAGLPFWLPFHHVLSWLGLVLSWPGLFGYFLLREGYKTKQLWALFIPGAALIVFAIPSLIALFQ